MCRANGSSVQRGHERWIWIEQQTLSFVPTSYTLVLEKNGNRERKTQCSNIFSLLGMSSFLWRSVYAVPDVSESVVEINGLNRNSSKLEKQKTTVSMKKSSVKTGSIRQCCKRSILFFVKTAFFPKVV